MGKFVSKLVVFSLKTYLFKTILEVGFNFILGSMLYLEAGHLDQVILLVWPDSIAGQKNMCYMWIKMRQLTLSLSEISISGWVSRVLTIST